jgi:hypothetical protein
VATPTQIRRRGRWSLVLGTLFAAVALAAVAFADDITNNLDLTVDSDFEVMTLTSGGSTGSTTLAVVPRGGDGKPGCNFGGPGNPKITFSVSSSDTAVATVSPTSVEFDACGDTAVIAVTPGVVSVASSANVTMTETSNGTAATFSYQTARFTVNVEPPPNTPPSVSVTGVTHGASYTKASVPTAGCLVSDTEDGLTNSTSAAAPSLSAFTGPYAADGIGSQTATCSYTDGGGLTQTVGATYTVYDPSAPTISYTITPNSPDGNNGWYRSNVTVIWHVGESESPSSLSLTGCVNQSITADQAETTYTCAATSAGGSAGPVSVSVKRDGSAPSYDCGTLPTGWRPDNVTLSCTAADVGPSGLANPADASFSLATSVNLGEETAAALTEAQSIADDAGNTTTAQESFMVDRKSPSVSCGAANSDWHNNNQSVICTATDGGSGPATQTVTLNTSVATGVETDSAMADSQTVSDLVGNAATAGPVGPFKIDRRGPAVTATCPSNVILGSTASAAWAATDGGSGVAPGYGSGTVTGLDTGSVGTKTVTVTAGSSKDNVGNDSPAATCSYSVIYNWSGFFQPIDNLPHLNKAKAGSAIPVKFSLGGDQGLDIFASAYPSSAQVTCGGTATADPVEETVTAGQSNLNYGNGQYVYVWKTLSSWANTCRTLTVKLDDGTVHQANVWFVR